MSVTSDLGQTLDVDLLRDDRPAVGSGGGGIAADSWPVAPRAPYYLPLKGMLEWLTALVLCVLTAPVMLFLAVLVKLTSPGPVIYAQTRLGLYGRPYRIFKLRTMVHDAETHTGPVWAAKQDQRVTRLGRTLRSTHLDELPQLWNVLRRDMNLIGPRPERPELAARIERHVSGFRHRLRVRPGITGLAQMLCPADDPDDKHFECARRKLAHDLYYVREAGFILDARIALSTICYFAGEALISLRHPFVRSCGVMVERAMARAEELEEEAEAA